MQFPFSWDGFVEHASGARDEIRVAISQAMRVADADDYYCTVELSALLKSPKRIFGIDEAQARELAVEFVKSMLSGRRLVDGEGVGVIFPPC
jgi:hypothetical protein